MEGFLDDVGQKGENPIPLSGGKRALIFIVGVSKPVDKLDHREDWGGNLMAKA